MLDVIAARGAPAPLGRAEAESDVAALLSSFELQRIRRYLDQVHWRTETLQARVADRVENRLQLENVAAHSWHVADAAMLIGAHFSDLSLDRVCTLAVLHDKLELFTGDFDPVGSDGEGMTTHAFCARAAQHKVDRELAALNAYLATLSHAAARVQREILTDAIYGASREARFVKAVDKLQALAFVHVKKRGHLSLKHFRFTVRLSAKALDHFPAISLHYGVLIERFVDAVSRRLGSDLRAIASEVLKGGSEAR